MDFVDTHLHVGLNEDPAAFFGTARGSGVTRFLALGADPADNPAMVRLAGSEPGVFAAVGVHPHHAREFDGDLAPFREWLQQPRVVAVGEIGLDYFYHHSHRDEQIPMFRKFLELALEVNKPAVIHCREATADLLAILGEMWPAGRPFEVHSFSSNAAEAEQVLALGAMMSVNGMVTFPKAENVREILRVIPMDRLLLETDSPYLTPEPFRKQRNGPKHIPAIAARVAQEKGISLEEVARITTANACRFFGMA